MAILFQKKEGNKSHIRSVSWKVEYPNYGRVSKTGVMVPEDGKSLKEGWCEATVINVLP